MKRWFAALLAALLCGNAAAQTAEDRGTAYMRLWLEANAGLLAIAARTSLNPEKPDPKVVADLKQATDRLEKATSGMLRVLPREDSTMAHAALVSRLIEVVGAARDVLDHIGKSDAAETAASLDWLDEAISQVSRAVSRVKML